MESIIERNKRLGADQKRADFMVKQKQPYWFKKQYAEMRIREFIGMCEAEGYNYHVSVGGLDSITLYLFIRSLGINVPAISTSYLEDRGNQTVHRALGIETVLPVINSETGRPWTKAAIIQKFGFPAISKEIAAKIEILSNPTEKNKTVRHAIITGETGEYGGFAKGSRMQLSQKWLDRFGGLDAEGAALGYGKPPEELKISSKCCYYLKEKPCDEWAKEHNSVPFVGLMASEGGRREKALMLNGCNYWSDGTKRSAPFAIFMRDDILTLALEMDAWYKVNKDTVFAGFPAVDSIIPSAYGEIVRKADGHLDTTKAKRTGCSFCGFGVHLEKRPHRFDLLYEDNPKEWEYLMFKLCKDKDGNPFGWGRVLDYIGVEWRPETLVPKQIEIQI